MSANSQVGASSRGPVLERRRGVFLLAWCHHVNLLSIISNTFMTYKSDQLFHQIPYQFLICQQHRWTAPNSLALPIWISHSEGFPGLLAFKRQSSFNRGGKFINNSQKRYFHLSQAPPDPIKLEYTWILLPKETKNCC